ncbi:hypothetical protein TomMM35A_20720 [Sphingobium sp. TomMM35A]
MALPNCAAIGFRDEPGCLEAYVMWKPEYCARADGAVRWKRMAVASGSWTRLDLHGAIWECE